MGFGVVLVLVGHLVFVLVLVEQIAVLLVSRAFVLWGYRRGRRLVLGELHAVVVVVSVEAGW